MESIGAFAQRGSRGEGRHPWMATPTMLNACAPVGLRSPQFATQEGEPRCTKFIVPNCGFAQRAPANAK